jgi:hypothetical protein
MSLEKENFLRTKLVTYLQKINPAAPPLWGKMSVHQMIEHLADVIRVANGKIKMDIVTPREKLPFYLDFLMSEKPFKENTQSPVLPAEPLPLRTHTVQAAIGKVQEEVIAFFEAFDGDPSLKTVHPVFGKLDFTENVQCLYKHCLHHLKQFGVVPLSY